MKKTAFILCCCLLAAPALVTAETTITEDQDRVVIEITGSPSENRHADAEAPLGGSIAPQEDTSSIDYEIARLLAERDLLWQQAYEGEPAEDTSRRRIRMSEINNEMKALQMRRQAPAGQ
jgi:hypothetical protein